MQEEQESQRAKHVCAAEPAEAQQEALQVRRHSFAAA